MSRAFLSLSKGRSTDTLQHGCTRHGLRQRPAVDHMCDSMYMKHPEEANPETGGSQGLGTTGEAARHLMGPGFPLERRKPTRCQLRPCEDTGALSPT